MTSETQRDRERLWRSAAALPIVMAAIVAGAFALWLLTR
jgi:hypothetical protein